MKRYSKILLSLLLLANAIHPRPANADHFELSCSRGTGPFVSRAKIFLNASFSKPNLFCFVRVINLKGQVVVVFAKDVEVLASGSSESVEQRVIYEITINKISKRIEKATFAK